MSQYNSLRKAADLEKRELIWNTYSHLLQGSVRKEWSYGEKKQTNYRRAFRRAAQTA